MIPRRTAALGLSLATLLLSAADARRAHGQGFSMLSPMPPKYLIGGFEYVPPEGDGWREISSSPNEFRIVYAEQVEIDTINTRVEFWMRVFEIEDPAQAPDGFRLALVSLDQRKKERGDALIASSNIELLGETAGIFMYSLVTRVGNEDVFETFYVLLAPDKSGYVAAKFVSPDADYDRQPYYKPFLLALATLQPLASVAAPVAKTPASGAEEGGAEDVSSPPLQGEKDRAGTTD